MKHYPVIAAALLAAACQAKAPRTPPPPDTCGASMVAKRWTGQVPSPDARAAIEVTVGQRPIRYYREGGAITMDYASARLNVVIGKTGRIKRFTCG
jgi:hypothetical protein